MSEGTAERIRLTCSDEGGRRVDQWISEATGLSRTQVHRLLKEGRITLDGAVPRKSESIQAGSVVVVEVPEPQPTDTPAQDLPLRIVYEDEHLLVVDKEAGMVVHPAPGHPDGTMVNALLHHVDDLSGIGGALRPGIVHRLDKDTSGLLVVAKSDAAHQALSDALRARTIRRGYLAAAWGHLAEGTMLIDEPIGRDPKERKRMAVVENGRKARTHVRVVERWPAAELLEVRLETGRTHQIRVHLAHIGHPVVGDRVYGRGWVRGMGGSVRGWARELHRRVPRQFLHAARLEFDHPITGEPMAFDAPLPPDLAEVVAWVHAQEGTT